MFEEIKRKYNKDNSNREFDIFYCIMSTALFVIVISLALLEVNQRHLFFMYFSILIFSICLFTYTDSKKYVIINLKNIRESLHNYFVSIESKNINKLVSILKELNIETKQEIYLCIEHYRRKGTVKIKNKYFEDIFSKLITLSAFIIVGYNDNLNLIDYKKLADVTVNSCIIIVIYIVFSVGLNMLISKLFFLEGTNEKIESSLSYIYINFNIYFNVNNEKKQNIQKKSKQIKKTFKSVKS